MNLYDYQIIKCDFELKPEKICNLKLYNELKKSPYCIDFLYNIQNVTLYDLIEKNEINYKQKLSIIIQCLYTMYIMHQSNYYHNDTHTKNIMITFCDFDKLIKLKINDKIYNLKSYGHIVTFIDYGMINHTKFLLNKKDEKDYIFNKNHNMDLFIFIDTCLINDNQNIHPYIKYKKNILYKYFKKLYEKYYIDYLIIKNQYLGLWNDNNITEWFNKFEQNKLSVNLFLYKGICFELIQLLCIYNRDIFCKTFEIPYFKLFIDDDIVKIIKLNLYDEDKTIIELLKYI
jgi:hypothetical protein